MASSALIGILLVGLLAALADSPEVDPSERLDAATSAADRAVAEAAAARARVGRAGAAQQRLGQRGG